MQASSSLASSPWPGWPAGLELDADQKAGGLSLCAAYAPHPAALAPHQARSTAGSASLAPWHRPAWALPVTDTLAVPILRGAELPPDTPAVVDALPEPWPEATPDPEPPHAIADTAPANAAAPVLAQWAEPGPASDAAIPDAPRRLPSLQPRAARPNALEFLSPSPPPSPPLPHPAKRRAFIALAGCAALAVLALAVLAAYLLQPVDPPAPVIAMFHAPTMILRAALPGTVVSIDVKPGQHVDPSTLLLTLRAAAAPNPALSAAQTRVSAAQQRLSALDSALSQPVAAGEAAREHALDLRRQRAFAAAEWTAAEDALAHTPAAADDDLPVQGHLHGVVQSLDAQPGEQAAKGDPLVGIADCDHPFFTAPPAAGLRAGETVQIKLANRPLLVAVVRPSSGSTEPPNSLVLEPPAGTFDAFCPVGEAGILTPEGAG